MTPASARRPRDRGLRDALEDAHGQSEFVIVVVADIRGFSEFSHRHESPDVAMYIKRVYMTLIDQYFPGARFYKATGDGLLITVEYDERTLKQKVQDTVQGCVRCVGEFSQICTGDPMVNFPTPDKIGFGIARGTACCLVSGTTILDYSGHILNLATRLMDLARPAGIVLDAAVDWDLLEDSTRELFEPQSVYIRSVEEAEPKTVYVLKGAVEIPEEAKRPIAFERWETVRVSKTLREWKAALGSYWRVDLAKPLKRPDGIRVVLDHETFRRGKPVEGVHAWNEFYKFRHAVMAGEDLVMLDVDEILQYARSQELRQDATLTAAVSYVPR